MKERRERFQRRVVDYCYWRYKLRPVLSYVLEVCCCRNAAVVAAVAVVAVVAAVAKLLQKDTSSRNIYLRVTGQSLMSLQTDKYLKPNIVITVITFLVTRST